ncbi:hypothetical protein B0J18DRAFT_259876 [Chaetomium sp. MPI-SDFR-AT-0129]|nr:hypothetical protein B0J18DRAFT_259876 [Chaetomium sp. MPI-SDFR-AT-0129]
MLSFLLPFLLPSVIVSRPGAIACPHGTPRAFLIFEIFRLLASDFRNICDSLNPSFCYPFNHHRFPLTLCADLTGIIPVVAPTSAGAIKYTCLHCASHNSEKEVPDRIQVSGAPWPAPGKISARSVRIPPPKTSVIPPIKRPVWHKGLDRA